MQRMLGRPHSAASLILPRIQTLHPSRFSANRTLQSRCRRSARCSLPETETYDPVEGKASNGKLPRPASYEFDTHQGTIDGSDEDEPEVRCSTVLTTQTAEAHGAIYTLISKECTVRLNFVCISDGNNVTRAIQDGR